MSDPTLRIRRVAVLGAGVMGAQIAAHLVNASVETLLYDLPAKEGDKSCNPAIYTISVSLRHIGKHF